MGYFAYILHAQTLFLAFWSKTVFHVKQWELERNARNAARRLL